MFNKTNWLAIVAAAVAGMVLGFLWYGQIFIDTWMAGNGITMTGEGESAQMFKNGKAMEMSNLPMIINTVALLFYALVMDWLVQKTNFKSWAGGAKLGSVIGFVGLMLTYVGNRFAGNPTSLSMIDGLYTLVLFAIIGAIIGGWRKE